MTEATQVEIPEHVLRYIHEHEILTLATASPTGVPRAATLTYADDGVNLYVWTRPETATARHVEQNRLVSFTIDEYSPDWRKIKGVQGTGEAQVLLGPADIERALELFRAKFPALEAGLPSNTSFFRIAPSELVFIDNSEAGGASDQSLAQEFPRELAYSVFRDLPAREVETIASKLQQRKVAAGTVIVRQGAPADKFFIVVDGEVEVTHEEDGKRRTLARLGPGQFFGEMAILRDSPRMATVEAVAETTLLEMEREAFRGLVAQSLGTTEHFDEVVRERLSGIAGA